MVSRHSSESSWIKKKSFRRTSYLTLSISMLAWTLSCSSKMSGAKTRNQKSWLTERDLFTRLKRQRLKFRKKSSPRKCKNLKTKIRCKELVRSNRSTLSTVKAPPRTGSHSLSGKVWRTGRHFSKMDRRFNSPNLLTARSKTYKILSKTRKETINRI